MLPFQRAVVLDPAFTSEPFSVHTRWIETEFTGEIAPWSGTADDAEPEERTRVVVEVGGKRVEVVVPTGLGVGAAPAAQVSGWARASPPAT